MLDFDPRVAVRALERRFTYFIAPLAVSDLAGKGASADPVTTLRYV